MRKTRKFLALLLIFCMVATFAPAAFAEDTTTTPDVEVVVTETDTGVEGTVTVAGGEPVTQTADGTITYARAGTSDYGYAYGWVNTSEDGRVGTGYYDVEGSTSTVTVNGNVEGGVYVQGDDPYRSVELGGERRCC